MRDIGIPETVLGELQRAITYGSVSRMVDWLLCVAGSTMQEKLRALETTDLVSRLQVGVAAALREQEYHIQEELDKKRREFYLRHQVHMQLVNRHRQPEDPVDMDTCFSVAVPSDDDDDELAELVEQLNNANLPLEARTSVSRDIKRLRKLTPSAPESGVLRSYLEVVATLPWNNTQMEEEIVNIAVARDRLDQDHYGLEHVKRRILEYLSVIKVKRDLSPPILCFVGPPGVGKTTLAKSIATALQRKFHRISLGSIRDEADIRGHRRTYVAAMPGLLISGMRKCGVKNPVVLLDEIDKMVQNSAQGDPGKYMTAAMLEVLDPAQSSTFMDHFMNIPYDLSKVLFIATANSMDSIPGPLLDRMEVVQLQGYTSNEKIHIARSYLWQKQIKAHGLEDADLSIDDTVLQYICDGFTQESGVRNLDRCLASICRFKCHEYANMLESNGNTEGFKSIIEKKDVQDILGPAYFERESVHGEHAVSGVVSGLAYAQSGVGDVLRIETTMMPGKGRLTLTGSLGDVIKESAYIAASWVKANAYILKVTGSPKQELLADTDLHIHMPSGAVPKDGPSAGITMAVSIVSLLLNKTVSKTTAMTGEITLRGQVQPVGGIKEKVISAHRAGIRKIILPVRNRRDVEKDIPKEIKQDLAFVYARTIWDALEATELLDPMDIRPFECRL
ncbi:ATP-dependent protease La [Lichtheimia hyalospora FSU 10163]|nr:ATP-dependent protease La [Lichtheimia hyalospora FSU 10163]